MRPNLVKYFTRVPLKWDKFLIFIPNSSPLTQFIQTVDWWYIMLTSTDQYVCPPGTFKCRGSTVCLVQDEVCDGFKHCSEADDELFCGEFLFSLNLLVSSFIMFWTTNVMQKLHMHKMTHSQSNMKGVDPVFSNGGGGGCAKEYVNQNFGGPTLVAPLLDPPLNVFHIILRVTVP